MEDTSLECERFLVSQWAQSTPLRVRRQLSGAWNCGCQLAGREVSISDPFQVTQTILDILTSLNVNYLVGGSVASSLYGEPRYTQDTDIEIWADRTQVESDGFGNAEMLERFAKLQTVLKLLCRPWVAGGRSVQSPEIER